MGGSGTNLHEGQGGQKEQAFKMAKYSQKVWSAEWSIPVIHSIGSAEIYGVVILNTDILYKPRNRWQSGCLLQQMSADSQSLSVLRVRCSSEVVLSTNAVELGTTCLKRMQTMRPRSWQLYRIAAWLVALEIAQQLWNIGKLRKLNQK